MNVPRFKLLTLALACVLCGALTVPAACAQKATRPYEIRYTSGRVTNAGWEKVLVEDDPNLKHWNWSAMSDYTQSYKRVAPGAFQRVRPRNGVYAKPVHLSPLTYAKARPVPAPITVGRSNVRVNAGANAGMGGAATAGVNGQVLTDDLGFSARDTEPVLSYGSYLRAGDAETVSSQAESRKVQGKLLKTIR